MYNNGVILSGVEGSRAITMKTIEQKAKKVPTIRFAGFDDEWVEKKLGDEAIELIAGGDIDKAKVVKKGKFPIYANALTNDGIVGYYDDFFRVKAPAVTITGRGEVGYAKARKENFTPVVRLLSVRSNHDSDFLENAINIHNVVVESTGVPQLTVPQISSYDIFFPCLFDEEKKLGSFFSNIDSLISLEQKKYDKLTQVKKSMLEKMFPKEGATVPEIRFANFTGDWKEKKLSEIAVMHARIGWQNLRTSEFLDSGEYMLITGTDFQDGVINFKTCHYVEKERYDQDKHIQIKNGSILITKDGTLGKVAFVDGLKKPATLNAGVFNVENQDDVDGRYLFQYLKAPFLMDYVSLKATGGTIKHLNQNILVDFPVKLPSKSEQQTIGSYFSHLDSLISLQQRKLEKLKNIKKSLLEKMFV